MTVIAVGMCRCLFTWQWPGTDEDPELQTLYEGEYLVQDRESRWHVFKAEVFEELWKQCGET